MGIVGRYLRLCKWVLWFETIERNEAASRPSHLSLAKPYKSYEMPPNSKAAIDVLTYQLLRSFRLP
jgi:hypothetical protein